VCFTIFTDRIETIERLQIIQIVRFLDERTHRKRIVEQLVVVVVELDTKWTIVYLQAFDVRIDFVALM
jgi:hypothetical protein